MAHWAFFQQFDGQKRKVGEAYNSADAEAKRLELLATVGDNLVVRVDGKEIDSSQSLK